MFVCARTRQIESVWHGLLLLADHHNREIVRPVDDSVVRCMNDRQVTIRAARCPGYVKLKLQCETVSISTGLLIMLAVRTVSRRKYECSIAAVVMDVSMSFWILDGGDAHTDFNASRRS